MLIVQRHQKHVDQNFMAEERYIDEKYKKSAQEETYEAKLKRLEKTREMFEDLGGKKSVKHYES